MKKKNKNAITNTKPDRNVKTWDDGIPRIPPHFAKTKTNENNKALANIELIAKYVSVCILCVCV